MALLGTNIRAETQLKERQTLFDKHLARIEAEDNLAEKYLALIALSQQTAQRWQQTEQTRVTDIHNSQAFSIAFSSIALMGVFAMGGMGWLLGNAILYPAVGEIVKMVLPSALCVGTLIPVLRHGPKVLVRAANYLARKMPGAGVLQAKHQHRAVLTLIDKMEQDDFFTLAQQKETLLAKEPLLEKKIQLMAMRVRAGEREPDKFYQGVEKPIQVSTNRLKLEQPKKGGSSDVDKKAVRRRTRGL